MPIVANAVNETVRPIPRIKFLPIDMVKPGLSFIALVFDWCNKSINRKEINYSGMTVGRFVLEPISSGVF